MVPHCWLLTFPRSGSSYMADCLNATRGILDVEIDNPIVRRMLFIEHAHGECCNNQEQFWRINPVHTKLHAHHHQRLKLELPRDGKYVVLDRDPVDVAVSVYLSETTGIHHVHESDEQDALDAMPVEIEPGRLGVICGIAMEWSQYWRSILHAAGIAHIAVDYHKATSDPLGTCEYVFNYFGVRNWDANGLRDVTLQKMNHPQRDEIRQVVLKLTGRSR